MFSFNFSSNEKSSVEQSRGLRIVEDSKEEPSLEISPNNVQTALDWREVSSVVKIGDVDVVVVDSTKVVEYLRASGSKTLSTLQADEENSDLVPGVYEGGMKVWECTYDLGTHLRTRGIIFENQTVLDLGCGAGILGIIALRLGSSCVHFQDYNSEVLLNLTIPCVLLNGSKFVDRCKFWSGDWRSFEEVDKMTFDVILTSETIYNPVNHEKLHSVLRGKLKPGGSIYVAGKSYYFGVGGSMKGFRDVVASKNVFSSESVWTSSEGVKREIILLKHLGTS